MASVLAYSGLTRSTSVVHDISKNAKLIKLKTAIVSATWERLRSSERATPMVVMVFASLH
jgi:hypothetical protein